MTFSLRVWLHRFTLGSRQTCYVGPPRRCSRSHRLMHRVDVDWVSPNGPLHPQYAKFLFGPRRYPRIYVVALHPSLATPIPRPPPAPPARAARPALYSLSLSLFLLSPFLPWSLPSSAPSRALLLIYSPDLLAASSKQQAVQMDSALTDTELLAGGLTELQPGGTADERLTDFTMGGTKRDETAPTDAGDEDGDEDDDDGDEDGDFGEGEEEISEGEEYDNLKANDTKKKPVSEGEENGEEEDEEVPEEQEGGGGDDDDDDDDDDNEDDDDEEDVAEDDEDGVEEEEDDDQDDEEEDDDEDSLQPPKKRKK